MKSSSYTVMCMLLDFLFSIKGGELIIPPRYSVKNLEIPVHRLPPFIQKKFPK